MQFFRLKLFGRLDRYVAVMFVSSYATALLLVVGLFWVLDMAAKLDDFLEVWPDGRQAPTSVIVRYYVLSLPYYFLQVAPFVTLIASMFVVNRMLRNNEVVAALGAGVSAHRLLLPIFVGGALAAMLMFGFREWVARTVADRRDAMLDMLTEKRDEQIFEDLWLRDLHGSVVRLGEFRPASREAVDFEAFLRRPKNEIVVAAERASYTDGQWWLEGGEQYVMADTKEVSALEAFGEPGFTPQVALTFRRSQSNPLELSFGEVRELMQRDPDNIVYRTLWQYHLTFPLANLVLLLVGIPVMLGYERGRGSERMALGGLLALFYFGTDFVFRSMGMGGGVSPLMASWMPVLAFGSLGVVLFDSMRT